MQGYSEKIGNLVAVCYFIKYTYPSCYQTTNFCIDLLPCKSTYLWCLKKYNLLPFMLLIPVEINIPEYLDYFQIDNNIYIYIAIH